jgi:hypothetical protein
VCVCVCLRERERERENKWFQRSTYIDKLPCRGVRTSYLSRPHTSFSILMSRTYKSECFFCINALRIFLCSHIFLRNPNIIFLYHPQLCSRRQVGKVEWWSEQSLFTWETVVALTPHMLWLIVYQQQDRCRNELLLQNVGLFFAMPTTNVS